MKKSIIINSCTIVLLAISWMIMDWYLVRADEYPDNVHRFDSYIYFYPLFILLTNLLIFRRGKVKGVLVALGVTAVSSGVLAFLIMTIGIWFHFYIGGQL